MQHEDEMWKDFGDYMASWDPEKRRTNTQCTNLWQMTQSNWTKTDNLGNDLMELAAKSKELGWSDEKSDARA